MQIAPTTRNWRARPDARLLLALVVSAIALAVGGLLLLGVLMLRMVLPDQTRYPQPLISLIRADYRAWDAAALVLPPLNPQVVEAAERDVAEVSNRAVPVAALAVNAPPVPLAASPTETAPQPLLAIAPTVAPQPSSVPPTAAPAANVVVPSVEASSVPVIVPPAIIAPTVPPTVPVDVPIPPAPAAPVDVPAAPPAAAPPPSPYPTSAPIVPTEPSVLPLVATGTPAPTNAPTSVPTAVPTRTPRDVPTDVPTATPTNVPTATPTDVPTATPTDVPTATPTDMPTATPTDVPTATPTDVPTATPTDVPTATPTAVPDPIEPPTPTAIPVPSLASCRDIDVVTDASLESGTAALQVHLRNQSSFQIAGLILEVQVARNSAERAFTTSTSTNRISGDVTGTLGPKANIVFRSSGALTMADEILQVNYTHSGAALTADDTFRLRFLVGGVACGLSGNFPPDTPVTAAPVAVTITNPSGEPQIARRDDAIFSADVTAGSGDAVAWVEFTITDTLTGDRVWNWMEHLVPYCAFGDEQVPNCAIPTQQLWNALPDGQYQLRVVARSMAGGRGSAQESFMITRTTPRMAR